METKIEENRLLHLGPMAATLSNQTLEDIANHVANSPDFPSRISPLAQDAFCQACFALMLRHGQGSYTGFREDTSMQSVGGFYLGNFCTDKYMISELTPVMENGLAVEQLEELPNTAPIEPAGASLDSAMGADLSPLAQARSQVEAAYLPTNNLL